MTVEVKVEESQVVEAGILCHGEPKKALIENEKVAEGDDKVKEVDESEPKPKTVEKSSSYKEESNYLSDLKEFERKALSELKLKLEEAILSNNIFKKEEPKKSEEKTEEKKPEENKTEENKTEENKPEEKKTEEEKPEEEKKIEEKAEEKKNEKEDEVPEAEEKEKLEADDGCEADREISLWGVPLFPGKGCEGTDVVLLKFLRAREFKVSEAFEMLKKTLQWRKEYKIDSILDEDVCTDLSSAAYLNGVDREGHPVCYNIFGVFDNEELYQKTFGNEEKRGQFLRWRLQLMEKSIQKLELRPGGASSLLQINDLKNSPGPVKKELRIATKQAVGLLQDNYPELVSKNIFINVPFWYYALNALLSPFLTQRTKSKFVVARPAKVTETLLKYIPAQEIPAQYGGFKREDDAEFSTEDGAVSELILKAGSTGTIQIDAAEADSTLVWDLIVLGWDVNYKEEFVPTDEGSYTIIVQKKKKLGSNEGPIRNTFRSNESGKVVLTIENVSSKKKRVLYRYKANKCSTI